MKKLLSPILALMTAFILSTVAYADVISPIGVVAHAFREYFWVILLVVVVVVAAIILLTRFRKK